MSGQENKQRILLVDDSIETLEVLQRNLTSEGYQVYTAASVDAALEILDMESIDLVVTDYRMPQVDGLSLVRHVRENVRDAEILMITGYASIGGAVEAVKFGAEDYLSKPFTDEELLSAVRHALTKLNQRRADDNQTSDSRPNTYGMVGNSNEMLEVYNSIRRASNTPATVLITGESGTGKELVARAIHYSSPRASAPFVPVNCGGIPEGLLESELFGHVKGAFSGATETRAGFFQTADGGTIFLDEISETSVAMQVKLLRVLQDKDVYMVGNDRGRRVDVHIVAATNKDLQELIRKEIFRNDLFYRLSVITISLPPLRDRGNDILIMARHFADKFAQETGKAPIRFSDSALNALKQYDWPGNVRELENVIQRLIVMNDGEIVNARDLPSLMRFTVPRNGRLQRTLEEVEREHIRNVLVSVGGNKTRAAELLGIDRKTLREKLKADSTT